MAFKLDEERDYLVLLLAWRAKPEYAGGGFFASYRSFLCVHAIDSGRERYFPLVVARLEANGLPLSTPFSFGRVAGWAGESSRRLRYVRREIQLCRRRIWRRERHEALTASC